MTGYSIRRQEALEEARMLLPQVAEHFSLSEDSKKMAYVSLTESPLKAAECYRAIVNSLSWER